MELLKPPPKQSVSEWATANRILSSEASSEPGKYNLARAPFQKGWQDAISDPRIHTIVGMTSAQVGKTETFLNNPVGYFIAQDPAPILVIQPTLEMAQTWSKDRFAPMLRDSKVLKDLVKDPRARRMMLTQRQNRIVMIMFRGIKRECENILISKNVFTQF